MTTTTVRHTSDLSADDRLVIRALLNRAFEGRFDDEDWDHSLGGLHVLVAEGGRLIGHGSVVQRRIVLADQPLRTGYVEAVAVEADRRGLGFGAAVMTEAERIVRAAYELGALSASHRAAEFYRRRGWRQWRGQTAVLTPTGLLRTPEEDESTYVLAVDGPVELDGVLACDWRRGYVW